MSPMEIDRNSPVSSKIGSIAEESTFLDATHEMDESTNERGFLADVSDMNGTVRSRMPSFNFDQISPVADRLSTRSRRSILPVNLEPAPKPPFLINATSGAIDQFMAIYRTPGIAQVRKMTELDVLVGTLRTEVQQSYNAYKAEAILLKLAQDERLQEIAEKTHYTIVHLDALKNTKMGTNERKARTEMMFSEFSDFVVSAVSDEMSNILDLVMRQMLRAILFTEKLTV
uniref:Uncharacterized protein n=1 Tax=Caenorhabditis japonica TaxID=281687 RepID=A0A8R1IIN0_CAEJA